MVRVGERGRVGDLGAARVYPEPGTIHRACHLEMAVVMTMGLPSDVGPSLFPAATHIGSMFLTKGCGHGGTFLRHRVLPEAFAAVAVCRCSWSVMQQCLLSAQPARWPGFAEMWM